MNVSFELLIKEGINLKKINPFALINISYSNIQGCLNILLVFNSLLIISEWSTDIFSNDQRIDNSNLIFCQYNCIEEIKVSILTE